MKYISFKDLVNKLKQLGIPAGFEEIPYVKDIHGWPYDRTKFCLSITLPLYKKVWYCNPYEPRLDMQTIDELADFGRRLASLKELNSEG